MTNLSPLATDTIHREIHLLRATLQETLAKSNRLQERYDRLASAWLTPERAKQIALDDVLEDATGPDAA